MSGNVNTFGKFLHNFLSKFAILFFFVCFRIIAPKYSDKQMRNKTSFSFYYQVIKRNRHKDNDINNGKDGDPTTW